MSKKIHYLETLAETFSACIKRAAENSIPKLKPCERSKPWWNSKLYTLRKRLAQRKRQFKTQPLSKTVEKSYTIARNTYFQAIRSAKTNCWNNFLENA